MSTRRNMLQALTDRLRRRKGRPKRDDTKRTRISTPVWARTHEVVSPERDLSEWVHEVAKRDWENVKRGRNKR